MQPLPGKDFTQPLGDTPFDLIWVEGGTFWMGADPDDEEAHGREKPRHQVKVSGFWLGKYPVTQALWQEAMGDNPSRFPGPDRPVERVSWDDCQELLQKLRQRTGQPYRLPPEAEWEYAARGGTRSQGYRYAGSDKLREVGWNNENSGNQTQPVGQKLPNELGIFDLSGNVYEWCADWYGGSEYCAACQKRGVVTDPAGPPEGSYRVLRGGSWVFLPQRCRVSIRGNNRPDERDADIGLRLALPPVQSGG